MAGHLDPEVLAGFREGLLGRRRSVRIRAHLGACPTCASLDKDLAEVTELLASAPAPRMPGHLVARLENALAAEAAARTANHDLTGQDTQAADAAAGAAGSTGRRPRRTRRSWQPRPAVLGAAAAVVALLAVGGYNLASQQPAILGAASRAGAPHKSAVIPGHSATTLPDNGPLGEPPPVGQLQVIESGTDYLPSRLASQAQAVLAGYSSHAGLSAASPGNSSDSSGNARATTGPTSQLRSCAEVVTGGLSPLLVDEAHYRGRPATIIVLAPAAGRAGQVWVTEPNCTAANPVIFAHIQLPTG